MRMPRLHVLLLLLLGYDGFNFTKKSNIKDSNSQITPQKQMCIELYIHLYDYEEGLFLPSISAPSSRAATEMRINENTATSNESNGYINIIQYFLEFPTILQQASPFILICMFLAFSQTHSKSITSISVGKSSRYAWHLKNAKLRNTQAT